MNLSAITWKQIYIKECRGGKVWGWGSLYSSSGDKSVTNPGPLIGFENYRVLKIACSGNRSVVLTGKYLK